MYTVRDNCSGLFDPHPLSLSNSLTYQYYCLLFDQPLPPQCERHMWTSIETKMSLNFTHTCTRLECLQQEELPERLEFLGPEVPDGLLEGVLPHVELDDLEVVEDLHDLAEPAVLVDQVVLLAPVHPPRGEDAHQNDDSQAEEACNFSTSYVPYSIQLNWACNCSTN